MYRSPPVEKKFNLQGDIDGPVTTHKHEEKTRSIL
jgi:hypothetical protein